jgi:signal-transduction protein with cAMP-binding, CBS, and nucleotidyltransferase domain
MLIREMSAKSLYDISPNEYHSNVKRLGDVVRRQLDEVILYGRKMSRFETVLFFMKLPIFSTVGGITLSYLADISEELHLRNGERMVLDERFNNSFFVVVSGTIQFFQKGEFHSDFVSGQFIGEMLGLPTFVNTNLLISSNDSVIIRFNKDQFYELLSDNVALADEIIQYI